MYSYNPYYANYLAHYGVKHKSGRYPWGSGERPNQHDAKKLKKLENKLNKYNDYYEVTNQKGSYASEKERNKYLQKRNDTYNKILDKYPGIRIETIETPLKVALAPHNYEAGAYNIENGKKYRIDTTPGYYDKVRSIVDKYNAEDHGTDKVGKPDKSFKQTSYGSYEKKIQLNKYQNIGIEYSNPDNTTPHSKYKEYADTFDKNKTVILNNTKDAAAKELKQYTKDSIDKIKSNLQPYGATIYKDGTYEVHYDAEPYVGDHSVDVACGPDGKTNKHSTSING